VDISINWCSNFLEDDCNLKITLTYLKEKKKKKERWRCIKNKSKT